MWTMLFDLKLYHQIYLSNHNSVCLECRKRLNSIYQACCYRLFLPLSGPGNSWRGSVDILKAALSAIGWYYHQIKKREKIRSGRERQWGWERKKTGFIREKKKPQVPATDREPGVSDCIVSLTNHRAATDLATYLGPSPKCNLLFILS